MNYLAASYEVSTACKFVRHAGMGSISTKAYYLEILLIPEKGQCHYIGTSSLSDLQ